MPEPEPHTADIVDALPDERSAPRAAAPPPPGGGQGPALEVAAQRGLWLLEEAAEIRRWLADDALLRAFAQHRLQTLAERLETIAGDLS